MVLDEMVEIWLPEFNNDLTKTYLLLEILEWITPLEI